MATVVSKDDWIPFFESAGFSPSEAKHFAALFFEHKVRESVLPKLTIDFLKAMGISAVGDMVLILERCQVGLGTANEDTLPAAAAAEFRQDGAADFGASASPADQTTFLVKAEIMQDAQLSVESSPVPVRLVISDAQSLSVSSADMNQSVAASTTVGVCGGLLPESVRSGKTLQFADPAGNAEELAESGSEQCWQLPHEDNDDGVVAASNDSVRVARRKSSRLECFKEGKSRSISTPFESMDRLSSIITQPRDFGTKRTSRKHSSDPLTFADGELRSLPTGRSPVLALKSRKRASGQVMSRDCAEKEEVRSKRAKVANEPSPTQPHFAVKCEPIRPEATNDPPEEFKNDFDLAELDDLSGETMPALATDCISNLAVETKDSCGESSKGSLSLKSKAKLSASRRSLRVQRKPLKRSIDCLASRRKLVSRKRRRGHHHHENKKRMDSYNEPPYEPEAVLLEIRKELDNKVVFVPPRREKGAKGKPKITNRICIRAYAQDDMGHFQKLSEEEAEKVVSEAVRLLNEKLPHLEVILPPEFQAVKPETTDSEDDQPLKDLIARWPPPRLSPATGNPATAKVDPRKKVQKAVSSCAKSPKVVVVPPVSQKSGRKRNRSASISRSPPPLVQLRSPTAQNNNTVSSSSYEQKSQHLLCKHGGLPAVEHQQTCDPAVLGASSPLKICEFVPSPLLEVMLPFEEAIEMKQPNIMPARVCADDFSSVPHLA